MQTRDNEIASMPLGVRPRKVIQGKTYFLGGIQDNWDWAKGVAKELRRAGISVKIEKEVQVKYKLWCNVSDKPNYIGTMKAVKDMFKTEKEAGPYKALADTAKKLVEDAERSQK